VPRRQRAVLVLRFYDDLSEADAARVLGCSVGTVKSQAAKGLSRLRAVLDQEGGA
jgi:DNA-directed RNA polymerase specialized sigma24 family protein